MLQFLEWVHNHYNGYSVKDIIDNYSELFHEFNESKKESKNVLIRVKLYTDKSYVVCGDTTKFKDELKEFGCKWNGNLTKDPFKGWIFSKNRLNEFKEKFNKFEYEL